MTIAEIGALMDNFSDEVEENEELKAEMANSPDCSEMIKVFSENRDHDWDLTANKVAILGMLIVNVCKDLNDGAIDGDFVSERIELVLNTMLLPPTVWHQIQIELGEDRGIFPEDEIKSMFEKKFGKITWDKMINGEVVQPDSDLGGEWKSDNVILD
jgi:hypothetical protein